MWEFAVALLLLDVVGDSIFLVGAFGFAEAVTTLVGGSQVGKWIDTTDRLAGASVAVLCCGTVACMFVHGYMMLMRATRRFLLQLYGTS